MNKNTSIINKMSYDELIEASSVIDDYVHGYSIPEEFDSEKVKIFADEIQQDNDVQKIGKIREKLSSKIVSTNKKSVTDFEEAKEQYRQLMTN